MFIVYGPTTSARRCSLDWLGRDWVGTAFAEEGAQGLVVTLQSETLRVPATTSAELLPVPSASRVETLGAPALGREILRC